MQGGGIIIFFFDATIRINIYVVVPKIRKYSNEFLESALNKEMYYL